MCLASSKVTCRNYSIVARKIVVLSRGMKECLEVPHETLEFLKGRQIPAHVLPTSDAAKLYNQLAKKELVGGLFHTTC
jgi:hypothetical protein